MSSTLIPNGVYRVINAKYSNQDADLYGGQPSANVVGFHINSASKNMLWQLVNVGSQGNQFTLQNMADASSGAYAATVQLKNPVQGSRDENVWTVVPTSPGVDRYWILAPSQLDPFVPLGLVWSLANGNDQTPVQLVTIVPNDDSQVWRFQGV